MCAPPPHLCEQRLARAWWAIEEDAAPRLAVAREELWKAHRKDDGFFQRLLRALEPSNILPLDIGLFTHDRAS